MTPSREPTQCAHPACNKWTFATYCDLHVPCEPSDSRQMRWIGIVNATRVLVTRPKYVRRSEGYIAKNGAWIATAEAPYRELTRDVARGRTKAEECVSILPDGTRLPFTITRKQQTHKRTQAINVKIAARDRALRIAGTIRMGDQD